MMKLRTFQRAAWTAASVLASSATFAQSPAGPSVPAPPAADTRAADAVPLSIADLVTLVLRHNPNVRVALQGREAAAAGVTTAAARPNPELEAGAGQSRALLPGSVGGSLSSWSIGQRIENTSMRGARIEGAQQALEASRHSVSATANELSAQIRLRAYELLLRQEEAAAAGDALALLEQIRDRVRARVQSGEAPRYESIKADAEVIAARQRLEASRLAVDQAVLAIDQLAAGKLPARWRLAASLDDTHALATLDALQREAQDKNPELSVLRADLARGEARLREARASRVPGIELRYGEQRQVDLRQHAVGVRVVLPLLDQRRGPIDEAVSEVARARTRLEGRATELALQVRSASAAYAAARLRVDALGSGALPEAEAALRVAQAAYRFGERGILDVIDAQRLLRSLRADLIDARFRLQAAAVELEFLAGRYAVADTALAPRP